MRVRKFVRVEWITHAQHLHNYLAKQRAGKHPRDVILALFVVLLSVAANYLDGVRLWTPRGDATVHLEEAREGFNFRVRLLRGACRFHRLLLLLFSSGHRMPTAPSLVGLDVLLILSPWRSSCNVDKKYISLARGKARYSVTWMAEKKYTYLYISTRFI